MPDDRASANDRVLEAGRRRGIDLRIVAFDESTHSASDAARAVGVEVGRIVKSLIFVAQEADGRAFVALVSGSNRVDPSRLAAAVGVTRVRPASADEARARTGFSIGGIPPFGHREALHTVMDRDLFRYPTVWASAGTPTTVFEVAPALLRTLADAGVADVAQRPAPAGAIGERGGGLSKRTDAARGRSSPVRPGRT